MRTERPAHDEAASGGHVHEENCAVCGRAPGEDRKYTVTDEFFAVLLKGVCTSLDLAVSRASTRSKTTFIVRAPNAATHERLRARLAELQRGYELALLGAASAYLREHCGVELRLPAR